MRRDLFSRDAENDAAPGEGGRAARAAAAGEGRAARAAAAHAAGEDAGRRVAVVSPAPRVTPSEAAEQTGAFTGALGRVARRSGDEAPKKVVTPIGKKLEQWRDKYRAGYSSRAAPESFGEKTARPFRFTRPAVGWRCNLCFARNAADAACQLCHEAKQAAANAFCFATILYRSFDWFEERVVSRTDRLALFRAPGLRPRRARRRRRPRAVFVGVRRRRSVEASHRRRAPRSAAAAVGRRRPCVFKS